DLAAERQQFGHRQLRDRQAFDDQFPGVGEHQADDVLDQHALARPRRAEHDGDRVVGEGHVQPVEDRHAAESLHHVFGDDRPVARVGAAREIQAGRVVLEVVVAHFPSYTTWGNWLSLPLKLFGPCWVQAGAGTRFSLPGSLAAASSSSLISASVCFCVSALASASVCGWPVGPLPIGSISSGGTFAAGLNPSSFSGRLATWSLISFRITRSAMPSPGGPLTIGASFAQPAELKVGRPVPSAA